jgi:uncharacterized protein involved in cysteine biosynthesis
VIITDFTKALAQATDPKFIKVMAMGVGLTLLLLLGVTFGLQLLLPDSISLPWIGEIAWLSTVLSGFLLISAFIGSVFLMIPVASLFTGLFLDQVADAVEAKHYPNMSPTPRASFLDGLGETGRFLGLMLVVNLCALVVYLVATVFAPFVFWAVNGFLLGREYFQMVALRRMSAPDAKALRKRVGGQVFMAGVLMAFVLTIPVINLFVPVLATAMFTHLYHRVA